MSTRATNPIDFAKTVGCFCIVWYHSNYYWTLSKGNRLGVDSAKFYFISWAMPFFYVSAFYFITRYGIRKESVGKILRKLIRIFCVQVLVIIIYGSYRFSINFFSNDHSLYSLLNKFIDDITFVNFVSVFNSGNSTPAYFLAQLFYLYIPLYLLGRVIATKRYFSIIAIGFLFVLYFLEIENPFITKESYFYLTISISILVVKSIEFRDNRLYNALFWLAILLVSIWRIRYDEFLLIGIAIWCAFSLLSKGEATKSLVAMISRFGNSYSLFVFLFHLLALEIIELIVSRLGGNAFLSDFWQITTFVLINTLAFGSTAIAAVILNRQTGFRLRI